MRPGEARRRLGGVLNYALLTLLGLLFVAPVLLMVLGSLKPDARVLAWRILARNYPDALPPEYE